MKPYREIWRVLCVSTAHLTPAERDRLDGSNGSAPRATYTHTDGFGVMLFVPRDGAAIFEEGDSKGLAGVLALARSNDCPYVAFDFEADEVEGLETYNDEGEPE